MDLGDAAPDLTDMGGMVCSECPQDITFLLDETEAPSGHLLDTTATEEALVNDGVSPDGVLLGQPGPPGFGQSVCFTGGKLQFPGPAFTTLGPRHTLEFMIQPLEDGLALLWTNGSEAGWKVLFSSRSMLSTFDPTGGAAPPPLQGEPRWVMGQWYHAAVVRDGSTVRAYLDGRLTGEQTGKADNDVTVPAGLLMGTTNLDFQGCLAWVRLWPCACYAGDPIAPPTAENL
jgi:concanavalin A-like lectin/glucanase superfamily protein